MLGSLQSPITSESLTKKAVKFSQILIDGEEIYVVESRPEDGGRNVIFSLSNKKDILPPPYSSKNGVHEYGGDSLCGKDQTLYFTNKEDQQIYEIKNNKIRQLTLTKKIRYAEPQVAQGYLYSIFEDHSDKEVINGIMKIDRSNGETSIMHNSHDFYAGITISTDAKYLSFFTWDFPNMSWDQSDVWKVEIGNNQSFDNITKISAKKEVSSCDPLFSPSGDLYYISDQSGFWNIYSEKSGAILKEKADFTKPHWHLGNTLYTFISDDKIAAVYTKNATDFLCIIENGSMSKVDLPFTSYKSIDNIGNTLYFIASSPTHTQGVFSYDLNSKKITELKSSQKIEIDSSWISIPEKISFTTRHNQQCHAFYYPPKNPNYSTKDELPPLLLISHGGPTGHNPPIFQLPIQYWTSRGFAVCDVNYSGSTGFGRDYRTRLYDNWGILDVDDCEDCALHLVDQGLVDKNRLTVRGGSAGGYTTLALLTFRETFTAGASYFGVSDLGLLAKDTHKFESRYLDKLIGPYPLKEDLYNKRSPLYHTDKMKKPILILQGTEDKVVPVEQAEKMYKALLDKNIPTAYLLFEGEGHGFGKKENIIKSIDSELYFYQRIFNQKTSFTSPPLIIDNI